jgi:predicted phosphodiesterase
MRRLILFHISDTHFALDRDKLGLKFTTTPGASGVVWNGIRSVVMKQKGTRAAAQSLWDDLLATMERTIDALQTAREEIAVLHTGDITQAGQTDSLQDALEEIRKRAKPFPLHAIVGNHDLWPGEFPALAPSKTAHQLDHVRNIDALPEHTQTLVNLGRGGDPLAELFLCCTAIADSLMNSLALGQFEPAGGHVPPPRKSRRTSPARGIAAVNLSRVRMAALHHPVVDGSSARWRKLQQLAGLNAGMVLLDAAKVQKELCSHDIPIVLCGHEHETDIRLCNGNRLLQLTAGCPTLWRGKGNQGEPEFSLYQFEEHEGREQWLTVDAYVCHLLPARWSAKGTYLYDGNVWAATPQPRGALLGLLGQKPPPPFP